MKKLISMTDFVLNQNLESESAEHFYNDCYNYANFLKQPLELWMFVPCDKYGNVVEFDEKEEKYTKYHIEKYQQAKERCLFDGFEYKHIKTTHDNYYIINNKNITWLSWNNSKTIEDLLDYNQYLQLTQTAIKQLGL